MAKTIDELKAQGAQVKNATVVGENTATRVGTLFTDIVEHVEQYEAGQTADTEANAVAISNEAQARAKADEQLNDSIVAEKTRAEAAEKANADNIAKNAQAITDEVARAQEAELANASAIEAETTRAKAAEKANADNIANETKRATTVEANISSEVAKKIDTTNFNNQLQKKADKDDVAASLITLENKIGERTEITGDVVNNPDEEDLTQQNNKLMLKNRAYEPLNYSGKGYKILRKNMAVISIPSATITVNSAPTTDGYISVIVDGVEMHINVTSADSIYDLCEKIASEIAKRFDKFTVTYTDTTVELTGNYEFTISDVAISAVNTGATFGSSINKKIQRNVNLLTQDMITKENTIYVIRYDYGLNNGSIKIPKDCVLKFDGGSLSNGSLLLQNTLFNGVVKIGGDFNISGTCANQTAYQNWFVDNNINAFIRFINNVEPLDDVFIVNFESGTYYPTVRLVKETNKNYIIEGNFAKLVYSNSSIEEGMHQIYFKAYQHDNTRHIMQSVVEAGSEFIEFDSTEGINAGDFLTLMDLNTSSFSVVRNYQQGEIIRVAKVEGNKVYPDGGIFGIYKNLSNSMCYGIVTDFIKVTVKNLVIEMDNEYPAEYDSRAIYFQWCLLELNNIYSQRFRYNIELRNCLNSNISNCKVYSCIDYATAVDNYGIGISHCQNIKIDGGEYIAGNHGIAVGGGYGGEYNIVNRFINIHDVKVKSRKYNYGIDGHGNCEYFKVSKCNGDGIRVGGDYITINNNSVDTIELSGLIGANVEVVENLINKQFYLSLTDISTYENSYNYFTKHTINALIGNNIFSKDATFGVLIRQHNSVNSNTINNGVIVVKDNITVNTPFFVQTEFYDSNDNITDEFYSTICIQDNISTEYNDGTGNLKGKKVYYRNNISNTRQIFACEEAYIENNKILPAESKKNRFTFDSTIYTLKYVNVEKNIIESQFVDFAYIKSFDDACVVFIKENTIKTGRVATFGSVYPEKLYFVNNILLGNGGLTNNISNIKNVVATCGIYNSNSTYNVGSSPNSIVQAFTKLFDSNRNSYYKDVQDNYFYPMSNPSCSLLPTTGNTFDVKYSSGTGNYQTVMGLIFIRYAIGSEPNSISTIAFRTEKGSSGTTKIKILGGNIEESLISIKIVKDGTNKDIYYNISITGGTLISANMLVTNMYNGVSINPCFKNTVDTNLNNPIWTDVTFIRNSGLFGQKPNAADIYVGFKYFCTDRQTLEGATDGIELIHKGNNVWVDALGRVIN